ncbi:hypothetical protein K491DRAFT_431196 [Lophiostoma macrostomum CBS 122681]|uniref:Uncharacterized protein n=1 Tax=Lophiostoma macrostomum CBS 122681 TaxID=1314788 RepID=A0A6A6T690_9PLEO|nr:hypothetical protein K491DRAFT_431196 [Lophiostoma macrostomum CBS 122681]
MSSASYIYNRRRSLPMNLHMNLTRSPPSTTSRPALRKWRPPTPRFPSLRATGRSPLALPWDSDIPPVPAMSFWEPDTPSEQDEDIDTGLEVIYSPSVYGDTMCSISPEVVHGMGVLPSPVASAGLRKASVHVDVDTDVAGFVYTWSPRFMFPRTPPVPPHNATKAKEDGAEMHDGKRSSTTTTSSSSSSSSSPSSASNPTSSITNSSVPSLSYSTETISTTSSSTSIVEKLRVGEHQYKQTGSGHFKDAPKSKRSIVDLRLNKTGIGAQHIGWSHSQSPVTLFFKSKEVEHKETIRERRWKASFI